MPSIPRLKLPDKLPQLKSMCLAGQSLISYEPETWELHYEANRYLAQVPETILAQRYRDILLNMAMLASRERDAIPINSVMSSWYWFRKEHQTRLEFALRGIELPAEAPLDVLFRDARDDASVLLSNADNTLYRYGRRIHIEDIARHGAIRISPASSHGVEHDASSIPLWGGTTEAASSPACYIFSTASEWDEELAASFEGADACLVIRDVEEFGRRLENAAAAELPGWRCFHSPVHYYDPFERAGFETIQAGISKHFRFAWQREYRFVWLPPNDQSTRGYLHLNLGNLSDLAAVHAVF